MEYTLKDADISPCGKFRYSLCRAWDASKPTCTFIGLNPSTADADLDDPTIRRCVGFADSWECGKLLMVNLWPYRATNPKDLIAYLESADIEEFKEMTAINSESVHLAVDQSKFTIAAWGNHGKYMGRGKNFIDEFGDRLSYLKINGKTGHPAHPLYLKSDLLPQPFNAGE